jgi:hypothetical protein
MTGENLIPHHIKLAVGTYKEILLARAPEVQVAMLDELGERLDGWAEGTEELIVVSHELVRSSDQKTIEKAQTVWAKPDDATKVLIIGQQSRNINEERIAKVLFAPDGVADDDLVEAMRAGIPEYPHLRPQSTLSFALVNEQGSNNHPDMARIKLAWNRDLLYPSIGAHVGTDYRTINQSGKQKTVPIADLAKMRLTINTHAQRGQARA